jgi:aminopeptidase YwaD
MLDTAERKVLGEAYSSEKAMDNLTTLCDTFGGRFAGSRENRESAEYILGLFEDFGFNDPHLESFRFMGCQVGESSLDIRNHSAKIKVLTLPMTPSGSAEGELVPVEDIEETELDGKIIIGTNRLSLAEAVEAGAIGFIWMHPYPLMGPPTGVVPQLVPSVSVKHEDGLLLKRLAGRNEKVSIKTECSVFERESWNVCGEVAGPGDDYVLLGGHYDGHEIAQAAFDCGAACMTITEMGRLLIDVKLKGSVRVVCFSAEEFGFYGSIDYAKRHADEMRDMRFTYQLDCNGGHMQQMVTTDYWPQLEPFYNRLKADLNLSMPYSQRMGPGDSRAFHGLGIPTGSINDYREPGRLSLLKTVRHTEYDTIDKISLKSLQDDVAIGAISAMRILASDDWPEHRSPDEVEALKNRFQG